MEEAVGILGGHRVPPGVWGVGALHTIRFPGSQVGGNYSKTATCQKLPNDLNFF